MYHRDVDVGSKFTRLKHEPRSRTTLQVLWWKTKTRNESESRSETVTGGMIDRSGYFLNDLSDSNAVRTRKVLNYGCVGRSQEKS